MRESLGPEFLSPVFLSPDVLSPDFLSPEALGPEFLCPEEAALWPAVMGDSRIPAITRHVESCESCQQRVAALRGQVEAIHRVLGNATPKATLPPPVEALPPAIGEYTILSRLGSGGQAEVYRAWHPRLKTEVVIKWFRRGAFPDAASSQLASEARVLSTIRHPYLAQVFDVGIEQDRHYLVMEYVSGHTFSAWMRRFQPTIPRIAAVIAKAAPVLKVLNANIRTFHSSQYIDALANGDACVAIGWSGDVWQSRDRADEAKQGIKVDFIIPKQGAPIFFDMMAIPKDAKHADSAYAFINFLLKPEVMAGISSYTSYANAIGASKPLIDPSVSSNPNIYPPEDVRKKIFPLEPLTAEVSRQYTDMWSAMKSGK